MNSIIIISRDCYIIWDKLQISGERRNVDVGERWWDLGFLILSMACFCNFQSEAYNFSSVPFSYTISSIIIWVRLFIDSNNKTLHLKKLLNI